jgi:monoamine oxidase
VADRAPVDVAVVGAGLAGLVAARDVLAAGRTAVVLEARDRVGGRLLNEQLGDGKVVEVGGQWVGPTQRRILDLGRELSVQTFPTHDEGDNVIRWRGSLRRYSGAIPRLGPVTLATIAITQARLDAMARTVPLGAPWAAPRALEWDGQTFWSWMRRNVPSRGARDLLELAVEAVWAVPSTDISLLHLLFYIHSAGSLDTLLSTEGGAQDRRFVGGSQLVALRLAERLGPDVVRLESPVRRIEHGPEGATVISDGGVVRARRAIVAIPPTLCSRIAYDPPLPGHRDQLTQRMPQGTVTKCIAIYERPFWRAEGLSGQGTSDAGAVNFVFDNSPPEGTPGVLVAFLEGRAAREWGHRRADERREAVLAGLVALFGERAASPERYLERAWAEEEWTRGCYGCSMTAGAWTGFGRSLREPIGPLHWAGSETATVWSGYMDGAVQSGERAASEALAVLNRVPVPEEVPA